MGTHTPTPWRIGDAGHTIFGPPNGNPAPEVIATVRKRENAATIVTACNEHERLKALNAELVEALEMLFNYDFHEQAEPSNGSYEYECWLKARAVLARATEGK